MNSPGSPEAEGLAAAVSASADAISRHRGLTLSASQVLARVAGGLARERGRILAALAGCSRVELNHVLARVNLAALLEVSGARVVDLLALPAPAGRLDDLGVLARAAVVDALQKARKAGGQGGRAGGLGGRAAWAVRWVGGWAGGRVCVHPPSRPNTLPTSHPTL